MPDLIPLKQNRLLMSYVTPPAAVQVITSARLHMGFFDLNGGLKRKFGSIGVSLERPETRLTLTSAPTFKAEGPHAERALELAKRFAAEVNLPGAAAIRIDEAMREHAGLGSGTQMALAVGSALARLYQLPMSLREVAAVCGRGMRSGVGVGAFELGGLIVDGGRGSGTQVPPLLSRMDFPVDWQILLIFDDACVGVHGGEEIEAFRQLAEFPASSAAEICRLVLMQALPSLVEHDLKRFGDAIYEIQCRLGDHFSPAQGGRRYASQHVGGVLDGLRSQGISCVGQSSWGPTGFAVLGSETEANAILQQLEVKYAGFKGLSFTLCKARNRGSEVQVKSEQWGHPHDL